MGVFKRGRFYWYSFNYRNVRVQKSTRQGDREEAKKLMAAERSRLARVEAGLEAPEAEQKHRNVTVGELLSRLEHHYHSEGKASPQNVSTLAVTRRAFGQVRAASLTVEDIEDYTRRQLAKGKANATVNRITGIVARAFRLARLRPPEYRHLTEAHNVRKGFFTVEEFEAVAVRLPPDLRDFCRFAFLTGWRKGEIASLRWSDVQDGVVRLRGENSKNRESRHVPLQGELTEIIERRRAERAVETPSGVALAEHVFHREGSPIAEFRKSWATACRKADVHRLFHDLRRSAVRNLVRAGVPQSVAMKISGHKTASVFRRYDITDERDLREAIMRVEQYRKAEGEKVVAMAVQ